MRILMVTRETFADKRYGLGQSLAPLITEFKRRGVDADYICQADLSARALLWQDKLQRLAHRLFGKLRSRTDFGTLFCVFLERFNMGRLAAKACSKQHYTHVHCHDPIIAAGYRFFFVAGIISQSQMGRNRTWIRQLQSSYLCRRRTFEPLLIVIAMQVGGSDIS